ncbi:DUF4040 family protein [Devriesea agamarum]|uniref:DUF4040 family protein n=1 Tax=Devriesea agamarum TaxID=472569 RepID=UPI00071E37FE|nr:DUF4040 family protein [Devriesea agamarum]
MPLLWTLIILLAAVILAPIGSKLLGRASGWLLAAIYLGAAGAFLPAALAVVRGGGQSPAAGTGTDPASFAVPWVPTWGVEFALKADGLGVVFTFIALLIGAAVLAYSARYLDKGPNISFYLLMATFTLSMVGLVLANDIIVLFICWELTSLASFFLIARSGAAGQGPSLRTLLITFVGGLFLLAAVALIVGTLGTTNLHDILNSQVWRTDPAFTTLIAVLVIIAAATKSAQFPFHVWLPDAMAAATPVSAYLHAAAVVKAGIFLLLRFSPAFHSNPVWNGLLIGLGLVTAFVGGYFALQQNDLKKLMAYSTVSQLGLIVTLIGVGTKTALTAAILHTIAHALFKSGLFMMVGVVDHAAHTRDFRRMPPMWRKLPFSFAITILGCASMAGLPPLLGFVSKESLLAGAMTAPGAPTIGWLVLIGIAGASVLTFAYCVKIVFGAFIDGKDRTADDSHGHHRDVSRPDLLLVLTACLPIVASLPLAIVVGIFDAPLGAAVTAAGHPNAEPHLALWHGMTLELGVTLIVIGLGVLIAGFRREIFPVIERHPFPIDGARAIGMLERLHYQLARLLERPTASDDPMRHIGAIVVAFAAVVLSGLALLFPQLAPAQPGTSTALDAVLLVLITAAVLLVCTADSRLAATVSLSAVGILATVQILSLGAPDVALTQLLVEALTIIVIMLVLQKLPLTFGRAGRKRRGGALAVAILTGLAAGGGTFMFMGRRGRSDIADYYIHNAEEITGGHNIVNVILVEFRALDTLGELAVLGMAGVAIVAVLSTVRHIFVDPQGRRDGGHVDEPRIALRSEGTAAHRAIASAWGNAAALQLAVRILAPLLALVSAILFLRGHNAPGGGFIAALVGSAIVGFIYLSTSEDRQIGPPRLPLFLIGGGIALAVLTGVIGFTAGGFLTPLHGEIFGQHVSTSMVFDIGVYMAVLGLVMVAFNLLGTSAATKLSPTGEQTRERTDEAVEGELPGPLDTTRGDRRSWRRGHRVGVGTSHLTDGTQPKEAGRR